MSNPNHVVPPPRGLRRLCLLSLAFLSVLTLQAQINTATISGNITDASGAALAGANIAIDNPATGFHREAQTNNAGSYSFPNLQPGSYDITVTRDGFQTVKTAGVALQINQNANFSTAMQLGSTQQTVNVTSDVPLIETSTAGLGTVIGQKETVDLPLNGRQFAQLLQLAPGTVPISASQSATPAIGAGSTTPSINGGSNRSNLFFIDGIYATDPFFSTFSISPSIDALQEFKEQTHTDLAEFGQATGGTINVATKGGTNAIHGTAYEFLRNNALDARNFFAPVRGVFRQNQFGGEIDGPVIKNKLFFAGFYDGYRYTQAVNNFTIVPTQAQRNGDFSGIGKVIYDPLTYNAATNTALPFAGNRIDPSRFNSGIIAYLNNFVPLPNYNGGASTANNYLNTEPNTINQDQGGIRIDYVATTKDSINGHFMRSDENSVNPSSLPQQASLYGFNGKNAGINWVHSINPTLVSTVSLGYNYLSHPQETQQVNALQTFNAAGLGAGFTPTPGATGVPKAPGLSANGYFSVGTGWGPIGPQHLSQYSGSVSKTAGSHNLKFGASYYQTWMYTNWAQNNETFNNQATWNPATRAGGDSFASMLIGLPNNASRQLGNSGVSLHLNVAGLYAQDSWRITNKLTLNYGLRWDYTSPTTDKFNRLNTIGLNNGAWLLAQGDQDAPGTLPPGVTYLDRNTLTKPNYLNFSPRLGFAYQLTPKTVVRGGFGIFYDNWSGGLQAAQNARGAWPSGASQNANNLNVAGVTPGATAQNPFVGLTPTIPASPFPSGGAFVAPDFKNAYSSQWNMEVQQQVTSSSTVSFAYVGSATSRSPIQVPFNVATPGPGNNAAVYARQPYQNMSSPTRLSTFAMLQSVGRASYESLQAKFDQRFSDGLFFITAFTWSRNFNIGCASFWEACNVQNPYNLNGERGPSPLDVPLVFTFSPGYELPFGKGKRYLQSGPASWLAGGWQVNSIFSARSGTVFTPTINFNNANDAGGTTQRPNVTGNPYPANQGINNFLNPAAFSFANPYSYGNAGRDSLRGPSFWNLDVSVFRNFQILEALRLQLRGEFFNIFNHTNFANPSSTLGNPNFGVITQTASGPRSIQLALKLNF